MPDTDVPSDVLGRLRGVCLVLPDAYEEQAWIGARWMVRKKTFAHVLTIQDGDPPAFAKAAGTRGPVCALTFRSSGPELDALAHAGRPYFRPPWGPDVVGLLLDSGTDWGEVAELLTESYCLRAPRKLVALLDLPEAR